MRLVPITPPVESKKGVDLQTRIFCAGDLCGRSAPYGEAFHAGWTFDRDGVAFKAYYCPVCTRMLKEG